MTPGLPREAEALADPAPREPFGAQANRLLAVEVVTSGTSAA